MESFKWPIPTLKDYRFENRPRERGEKGEIRKQFILHCRLQFAPANSFLQSKF